MLLARLLAPVKKSIQSDPLRLFGQPLVVLAGAVICGMICWGLGLPAAWFFGPLAVTAVCAVRGWGDFDSEAGLCRGAGGDWDGAGIGIFAI
jgi:hypothetical protein